MPCFSSFELSYWEKLHITKGSISNKFPVNFPSGPEQAIVDKILCIIVQIVLIYRELELRHAIL